MRRNIASCEVDTLPHPQTETEADTQRTIMKIISDKTHGILSRRRRVQGHIQVPLGGRWSWEIRRKSKPLGIKMTGDGFQSEMAAQFAGKRALADFLSDLSKEGKPPRK
jgi:hypothetical protein